jgi:hypothetical protein
MAQGFAFLFASMPLREQAHRQDFSPHYAVIKRRCGVRCRVARMMPL